MKFFQIVIKSHDLRFPEAEKIHIPVVIRTRAATINTITALFIFITLVK
jgi:hypothetical protein